MPLPPDDPRLTAYALGELDEADRLELETAIADDPDALALVAELRTTAALLTEQLRLESRPAIVSKQLDEAIQARLEPAASPTPRPRRWARLAIAAGLIGISAALLWPQVRAAREARRDERLALNTAAPNVAITEDNSVISRLASPVEPQATESSRLELPRVPSPTEPRPLRAIDVERVVTEKDKAPSAKKVDANNLYYSTSPPGEQPASPDAKQGGQAAKPNPNHSGKAKEGPDRPDLAQDLTQSVRDYNDRLEKSETAANRKDLSAAARSKNRGHVARFDRSQSLPGAPAKPDQAQATPADQPQPGQAPAAAQADALHEGEGLAPITDNPFRPVDADDPSTFSIDADTASYTHVRRILNQGGNPPRDAVRIEEMINYFPYAYPAPKGEEPFSVKVEVARAPWSPDNRLVRIGLKGRDIVQGKRPPSNLVFLIDVSGSMDEVDKLPLLKAGMKLMVDTLSEDDRVAIVVYASREGLVLSSTSCIHKGDILDSLDRLKAGGSTDGGSGIMLAYDVAVQNFIKGGTNRVILCTDGDFNVGVTEGPALDSLIEEKRKSGVFLSVFGFGQGNVKHDRLERLADKGNGEYRYIDSIKEARRVLIQEIGSTLVTIAKDVKIQVHFDPTRVTSYRLIGYENRVLAARDFNDDRKDAGEIGAGHCVTALYEVVPRGQGAVEVSGRKVPMLRVDLRYKAPDADASKLIQVTADDDGRDFAAASADTRFAAAVAGFGMLLRDSTYKGTLTWPGLLELAAGAVGDDPTGYRGEFLGLVRKAAEVKGR